ncbi:hypothetical protein L484_004125 [Morus notabilis]|uniref:Uncharacterized protein n=1 Tax=Morus notabilis TaxID=981085 RepID=W9S7K6_9ROSA|nr:hypothetical protein L484_004125 [Morus notabilis]
MMPPGPAQSQHHLGSRQCPTRVATMVQCGYNLQGDNGRHAWVTIPSRCRDGWLYAPKHVKGVATPPSL